ncbi:uncharacterized protein KQ657_004517 [Scheffersomyces spartinae]|uniref:Carbonic anhydrase n=1 Tax=Scheffersomyces spartinae TaxID=45513 RepID=A0A9P7VAR4_9ASCO|nr:uncharacterized protein KQ657_004517 [Scheffersomyces spartinae]KAG7194305.1 hypothetical protein KQ657_004517 [Scheffersomyces spartinae]
MGRENIIHYQIEHEHETDLTKNQKDIEEIETRFLRLHPEEKPTSEPTGRKTTEKKALLRSHSKHDNFPFTLGRDLTLEDYLHNNKFYVDSIKHNYADQIFDLNGKGQAPHTLWIGCSDSRAGESCLATLPGEVFTHRNIANIVNANDLSSQGVIQFAVDVLKVKKIIVCGHTDCGGVWASLSSKRIGGVLDLWLNPVRHIRAQNLKLLNEYNHDPKAKAKKLAELNVISSVLALKRHPSASAALKKGQIEVWGMMYDVGTGYLTPVEIPTDEFEDLFLIHDDEPDEEDFNPH